MARGSGLGRVLLGLSLVANTAPARRASVTRRAGASNSKPYLGQGGQITMEVPWEVLSRASSPLPSPAPRESMGRGQGHGWELKEVSKPCAVRPQQTCGEAEKLGGIQSRREVGSGLVSRQRESSLCGTVPREGDATCVKGLPEEAAACSAWRGKKNTHGKVWLAPPGSLASHLAGVTPKLHRIHPAAAEGHLPATSSLEAGQVQG